MLLVTDNKERTARHVATHCGKLEILQKVLRRAERSLTIEVINNKFLAQIIRERRSVT